MNLKELIVKFFDYAEREKIEIYNEFSFQHELGIFLRKELVDYKIQFERNVSYFSISEKTIKKEIDISIFKPNMSEKYAIELKHPLNGQYPEQMQAQVLNLLNDLNKDNDRSVILITHDLGVVANTCDRVIVMYSGMIMETATVDELFTNPRHPYTKGLLHSLPKKDSIERLTPIKGNPPDMTEKLVGCPFKDRCDLKKDICYKTLPEFTKYSKTHKARCHILEEDK